MGALPIEKGVANHQLSNGRKPMVKMPDTAIFAKPDIRDAIITMKGALKKALPNGSFAERERASLALSNEVGSANLGGGASAHF